MRSEVASGWTLKDRDVRVALLDELARRHLDDPGTLIVEELGIHRGERRVDVAVVNGALTGFEIKADRDDLSRLSGQAILYNLVFDHVILVVGERHADAAAALVPAWWGLWIIDAASVIHEVRAPTTNDGQSTASLVQLLWRDELLELLNADGDPRIARLRRRELLERASDLPLEEVQVAVRAALKQRTAWRAS